MPPVLIDLNKTDDFTDAVHRTVECLAAGRIVAIPTETVYGIAAMALNEKGADRLREFKKRTPDHPFALAINSPELLMDYSPNVSPLGQRLARRGWPGPLTLVVNGDHPQSVVSQFPPIVQSMVLKNGTVGLRVPDHPVFREVSRLMSGPILLTSANEPGKPECKTGEEVQRELGDSVDLILDDGQARYGQASTVVKIVDNQFEILRAGVFGESSVKRMSSFMALMVCTGNTCRSPMAELLFKKRIAERVGVEVDKLEEKGIIIASAGVAAIPGGKASHESVEVMKQMGLDLSDHESQPVSDRLLEYADVVITMTNGHRQAIVAHWPELADRVSVLCEDGSDVSDPIGGPMTLYESCAKQIDQQLKIWIDKIELGLPE